MTDDDPETAGGDLVARAWSSLAAAFMAQREAWLLSAHAEGLTPPQAMSLMRVSTERPPRLGELARFLRCDASQVTATADRLEERGFAVRRTAADDRRVKELVLTAEGVAARQRLLAAFLRPPAAMGALPVDDLEALARVGERLAAGLDPEMCRAFGLPEPAAEGAGSAPAG